MEELFLYFTFVYDWINVLQLIAVSFSVVLVLGRISFTRKGVCLFVGNVVLVFAVETFLNWMLFYISHFISFLTGINFPLAHLITIALYACFVSRYNSRSRIVLAATVFVTAIAMAELGTQCMRYFAFGGNASKLFAVAADLLIIAFAVVISLRSIHNYENIPKMQNVQICFGENCRVKICDSKYIIKNLDINARAENVSVNIGKDFSIESGCFDFHGEPNLNINIGNDCQFGCNIRLVPADGHTIYNNDNNMILNRPKDINIGDHVWLCRNVSVLKGVNIPDNCVAGLGSIITKAFDKTNSLIAGTPARIIESEQYKNIDWTRCPNRMFSECNTIPIE